MTAKFLEKYYKQRNLDAFCGLVLLAVIFGGWFITGLLTGYLLWGI
jgi:hypothetical protein